MKIKPKYLILPTYINYSHYTTICSLGVYLLLVYWNRTLSTMGFICFAWLLTVGASTIGWWVSFALSWPLIKLFLQAWWKRKSSFRGDWATGKEGDWCFVKAWLCCVSLLEARQPLKDWLHHTGKQLYGNGSVSFFDFAISKPKVTCSMTQRLYFLFLIFHLVCD